MNRFERRVRARVSEITDWLDSLGFEAVHGPSIDIAQDDSAALWCVTVRRLSLPDVLLDVGERIEPGADGLPAQYSYQARFCDRATGMAWQYRLDFHGHPPGMPVPTAHRHDHPLSGYDTRPYARKRYNPAIGELLETARARATPCEEGAAPKPPEDCVSWLNRVLS